MSKRTAEQIYKVNIEEAFKAGYKARTGGEAIDELSSNLSIQLETYVSTRVSEFNNSQSGSDEVLREQIKILLDELAKMRVINGRGIDKEVLNNIKNKL